MKMMPRSMCSLVAVGMISLTSAALTTLADDSATPLVMAPPLAYGVPQVIQLSQAHLSDSTIVTYVRNSGNSYGLDAEQIIYLRQQGVSEAVVEAMLTQPKPVAATVTYTPTPVVAEPVYTQVSPAPAPVTVTEVPSSSVYVIPDSATYRYCNTYASRGGYLGFSTFPCSVGYVGYYGGAYYPAGCYRAGYYRGGWHR